MSGVPSQWRVAELTGEPEMLGTYQADVANVAGLPATSVSCVVEPAVVSFNVASV